jgi:hypothetical protein
MLYRVNLIIGQEDQHLQQGVLNTKSINNRPLSTCARVRRRQYATSPTPAFSGHVNIRRKDSTFVQESEIMNTEVDVVKAETSGKCSGKFVRALN